MTAVRKCYPAMMHETGDKIVLRDCVLLKAGPRKNDLPFVAKIASLWENPEDGRYKLPNIIGKCKIVLLNLLLSNIFDQDFFYKCKF